MSNKYISQSLLVSTQVNLSSISSFAKNAQLWTKKMKECLKYIYDSKYPWIFSISKEASVQYLAFSKRHQNNIYHFKKASELGEIYLDYIKIHEDLSLERHKLLLTCHKHLSLAWLRHVLYAFWGWGVYVQVHNSL